MVQSSGNPIGQLDGDDSCYLTVKGGEVASVKFVPLASAGGTDKEAGNQIEDGYIGTSRPVVTTNLVANMRPLGLTDDGIYGYGTLFGSLIGGIAGQISYGLNQVPAVQLGPSTAYGSGKLTLWITPGTYAVTLDAVAADLQPGTFSLSGTVCPPLYGTLGTGVLTSLVGSSDASLAVGRLINFEPWKGGSLVTTPVFLVSALNSPDGIGLPQSSKFARALISFNPPT